MLTLGTDIVEVKIISDQIIVESQNTSQVSYDSTIQVEYPQVGLGPYIIFKLDFLEVEFGKRLELFIYTSI